MDFDLRLPIGLLFTAIGVLVAGFGAAAPARALSLGLNVDLAWGGVVLVVGLVMIGLALARRMRAPRP